MSLKEYKILGARCISVKSLSEYKKHINEIISSGNGGYSVAINAEKIMFYQENEAIRDIIDNSVLPSPDGVGALIGLKFLHQEKSIKVDLPKTILEIANENSYKLFVLGATLEVNNLAVKTIIKRYPNIEIVGQNDGFFKDDKQMIDTIVKTKPQIVMLALGTPKQELLAVEVNKILKSVLLIGCGGALDVLAGKVKRAPLFIQNLHLEWLHRLIASPSRIKRQIVLPIFLFKVIKASFKK